jgi:hypothetical protein
VQQLRDMPKLIILDLLGNPLCQTPDYRLYVVYYMRKLKVLDGLGIEVRGSCVPGLLGCELSFWFLVETSTLVRKGYDRNCNSLTACTVVLRC